MREIVIVSAVRTAIGSFGGSLKDLSTGTRVLFTLLHEMEKRNAKRGLATLCIGGGTAIIVER